MLLQTQLQMCFYYLNKLKVQMPKGWKTADNKPVKNADLWQQLDALVHNSPHQLRWEWVKGHAGNPGNEKADELANRGVEQALAQGHSG